MLRLHTPLCSLSRSKSVLTSSHLTGTRLGDLAGGVMALVACWVDQCGTLSSWDRIWLNQATHAAILSYPSSTHQCPGEGNADEIEDVWRCTSPCPRPLVIASVSRFLSTEHPDGQLGQHRDAGKSRGRAVVSSALTLRHRGPDNRLSPRVSLLTPPYSLSLDDMTILIHI